MYAVDENIPFISNIFLAQLFGLCGAIIIISIALPEFLVNAHLLTYLLTHSLTYSLTHLLTYSLTHLLTYSLTHLLT